MRRVSIIHDYYLPSISYYITVRTKCLNSFGSYSTLLILLLSKQKSNESKALMLNSNLSSVNDLSAASVWSAIVFWVLTFMSP